MPWPCETRTSTCRSFVTISSGLCLFLGISVLLDAKRHTSGRTTSSRADHKAVLEDLRTSPGVEPTLGRVDGFDQDEAESKRDERAVILRRLLASKRDTLEALELADRLFDSCPRV